MNDDSMLFSGSKLFFHLADTQMKLKLE